MEECIVALPGLVRVSFLAAMLGIDRRTAREHLSRAGCQPLRRPRVSAKDRDGPWYVTVEDSVRLIDYMLPRALARLANSRARHRLRKEARIMGLSGMLQRYKEGGTGVEAPPQEQTLLPHPPKSPLQGSLGECDMKERHG
jgi:hypothetical protein